MPLTEIVRDADNRFADIIDGLPPHLQPDEVKTDETRARDALYPWIPWQQVNLTLVLLNFRLAINRCLQHEWLADPTNLSGPRAICLSSAKGIIWISQHWAAPIARRRQWAMSVQIYAAGAFLAVESKEDYAEEIDFCISYLDKVQANSAVAGKAARILREFMASNVSEGGTGTTV
ncbi:hypothetical protein A1O3_06800 [Capronia epimyces CBS 606.96]|uniref:Uncharacterized protein n=1 Tax=Capronia epimyces CBS 606.96 TaxID=1182542 RepID=W9XRZ5_9EURO|nr:uncharacterized protein A1O3_06800 [Capronia epimyces CBS 606.96]EXJ82983.1 hypothetical protein A1O3_06800 [Capronia epimyces CBS 606.96]